MKNYLITTIGTQRKDYPLATEPAVQSRMLSLTQYHELARRIIGRFAPANARTMMLNSDDAVAFVAGAIMNGDWDYNHKKTKLNTYRGRRGKWAIAKFLQRLKEDEWAVPPDEDDETVMPRRQTSLDCEEGDDAHNLHELVTDSLIDNPIEVLMDEDECNDRRDEIDRLMDSLSERQRQCVNLFYIDGMKPFQIAKRLGVRRQAVQKTLERAMKRLRDAAGVPA